ncbi:outer membrane beta-barrel protein [Hymenobacter canadensis]|uniref:TonB-dependent receptor n=1 Tax=Hymenobacter canadensis TaxID=2999067 RepID=A0ABY7LTX3_9BACT|nr:outer membrane beta-barrel protein [Hymenobacter canadensis]WBA42670.1 TonB-dependent receptor [Hymenobacter canadensis]
MTSSTSFSQALKGLGFLAMLAPLTAAAQQPSGAVSGTLLDQTSGQPLPFANVVVLRAQDSTFVSGAQTGENGTFELASLGLGSYLLKASAIGYQGFRRTVALSSAAPIVRLGALKLTPTATQLKGVTVTGERATVQNEPGKRIINVEKDLASVGGMATDVLRNVPSVAVDANGTVSLRGSSNLTILIDGKPAGGSNGSPGLRLDQIPSSRIARIEVITNPSAKYDAQGTGVINVIMKKNGKDGINGQASVLGGTGDKYNASLNLSRHHGPLTVNASYDRQDENYRARTSSDQTARVGSDLVRTSQTGRGLENNHSHSLRLGLDYELNKEQSLSVNVSPTLQGEVDSNNLLLSTERPGLPATSQQGTQLMKVDVRVLENTASYRRTWAAHEGRELTATAGAVFVEAKVPVTQTLSEGDLRGWRQQMDVNLGVQFAQIDYVHPLADGKGKLETGLKAQRQTSRGIADLLTQSSDNPTEYVRDPARSLAYNFEECVPAAYITGQRRWGKGWNAEGGLRTEYTNTSGAVEGGAGSFQLDYLAVFPTASLSKSLGRADSASGGEQPQRLQLSYARRLDRPNFMQQLAVPLYQDPRSYRLGNPSLRAQFSHNLELGHQLSLPGGAEITTTLFGRYTTQAIQRLRFVDTVATRLNPAAGLVLAETYRNSGTTTNVGLEMTWSQPLTKWWRVQATGSAYRTQLQTNASNIGARRALIGTGRLTQNFTPLPTLDVQLTGSWESAKLTAQGRSQAVGAIDVALRQRLWQNRAALTFRVSDVLNTKVYRTVIDSPELTSSYYSKPETRVAWLGFTWYVGASKAKAGRIEGAPKGGGGFGG